MSEFNDKAQEGLVEYVRQAFNGIIEKEDEMARQTDGLSEELKKMKQKAAENAPYIPALKDGDYFEGIYRGYDQEERDNFGNYYFYFVIDGKEKHYSQASKNQSFLEGMSTIKDGQTVKVGRIGTGKDTKYIVRAQ